MVQALDADVRVGDRRRAAVEEVDGLRRDVAEDGIDEVGHQGRLALCPDSAWMTSRPRSWSPGTGATWSITNRRPTIAAWLSIRALEAGDPALDDLHLPRCRPNFGSQQLGRERLLPGPATGSGRDCLNPRHTPAPGLPCRSPCTVEGVIEMEPMRAGSATGR